jgi:hypothetical protein
MSNSRLWRYKSLRQGRLTMRTAAHPWQEFTASSVRPNEVPLPSISLVCGGSARRSRSHRPPPVPAGPARAAARSRACSPKHRLNRARRRRLRPRRRGDLLPRTAVPSFAQPTEHRQRRADRRAPVRDGACRPAIREIDRRRQRATTHTQPSQPNRSAVRYRPEPDHRSRHEALHANANGMRPSTIGSTSCVPRAHAMAAAPANCAASGSAPAVDRDARWAGS